jgi:putative ABC transport system permease protein
MAAKYFGRGDPLRKILRVNDKYDFQVTGVFKNIPENTHFHPDFLASFNTLESLYGVRSLSSWNGFNYQTYIQMQKGTSPAEFEKKITAFIREKTPEFLRKNSYLLQPLTGIHLGGNIPGELAPNSDIKYIYIFMAVAALIILITCCNYINLSTACLAQRANEVGMRKVVGAKRGQPFRQFLGESFFFTFSALILALGLLIVCLPSFNAFAGTKLDLSLLKAPSTLAGITVLLGVVCLASGYYPALYLSSLKPAQALKSGGIKGSKGSRIFRNILVAIQFTITTLLIVSTITIRKQMTFITNEYTGQMKEVIVTLSVNEDNTVIQEKIDVFKEELKKDPAILQVSTSSWLPTNIRSGDYDHWEGKREDEKVLFHNLEADYDFFSLFGIPIIEGRGFSKDFLRWVAVATIIAWPLSFYAARKWLQSFAYRTSLSLWIFAVATAAVLGIAVLTVAYQALKAAVSNPVDSLRYE